MRIGSLSGVDISQWTPTYQRTTVQKLVPGFIVAQTYDIVARANTLTINGYLVGASQSDLASQIMTLKGYANQKKIIWIDASDQYQGLSELVRITNLQGPTIDSSKGILTAEFTLQCSVLLPWGTTFANPYRQAGIVLRDLNGQGAEYMLDPLEFSCNFTINNPLQSNENFSWEFILDNQNATSGSQLVINECESITNFAGVAGSGIGISTDGIILKQGSYSVKVNGTSNGSGILSASYSSSQNLSSYDFLMLWIRADCGGATTGTITIQAGNSGLTSYYQWVYANILANVWYRLVIPLRNPQGTTGTPSLSSIAEFLFQTTGSSTATSNFWIDEILSDVGLWVYCECMIPDNITQNFSPSYNTIQVSTWNGSSYETAITSDAFGSTGSAQGAYFLDGNRGIVLYTSIGVAIYSPSTVGASANKNSAVSDSGAVSSLACALLWGTNARLIFAFKMPPATSDSSSGSYPSDDIGGTTLTPAAYQSINKVRMKVQIYAGSESTTYIGN
ncbi:MAG: hypothetical protein ACYCPW_09430 [Nitrososphaerales archaeon]